MHDYQFLPEAMSFQKIHTIPLQHSLFLGMHGLPQNRQLQLHHSVCKDP